jgi:hypothetical protein
MFCIRVLIVLKWKVVFLPYFALFLLGHYCDKNDREVKFVPYVFKHTEYLFLTFLFAELKLSHRICGRLWLLLYCFLVLTNY